MRVRECASWHFAQVGAPCSAKVSVQSTQAFLQQLQKQNPNATVSASTASEPLAAMAVKGTSEAATALWKVRTCLSVFMSLCVSLPFSVSLSNGECLRKRLGFLCRKGRLARGR